MNVVHEVLAGIDDKRSVPVSFPPTDTFPHQSVHTVDDLRWDIRPVSQHENVFQCSWEVMIHSCEKRVVPWGVRPTDVLFFGGP